MKKLIVLVAMTVSLASSASMIDWKYSGVAADTDSSIYLYVGSTAPSANAFADVDALKGDANVINTGVTVGDVYNSRTKTHSYLANGSAEYDWSAGDKYYFVLVSSDEKNLYIDPTAATVAAGNIYNKGETAGTTLSTTTGASSHTYAAFAPEPTSGLLMLVGLGALALRRRRA